MKKSCTNIEFQKVYTKDLKINTRYIQIKASTAYIRIRQHLTKNTKLGSP